LHSWSMASASSIDDKPAAADPFSVLDPLNRPASRTEPMLPNKSYKGWDVQELGIAQSASASSSTEAYRETNQQSGWTEDAKKAPVIQDALLDFTD